jgi:heptaprenyl diphosphate synthase
LQEDRRNHKMKTMKMANKLGRTHLIVLTGLIFSAALVLSIVENMLPPLPIAVPGVKFGLSNIAVMYALFFLGPKQAYLIGILKAFYIFITRGFVAFSLSMAGGLLSISVMLILLLIYKERITYLVISIFGAISHNVGQFVVIMILYKGMNMWIYFPILVVSGIIAGIITSTLLRFILPALKRLA